MTSCGWSIVPTCLYRRNRTTMTHNIKHRESSMPRRSSQNYTCLPISFFLLHMDHRTLRTRYSSKFPFTQWMLNFFPQQVHGVDYDPTFLLTTMLYHQSIVIETWSSINCNQSLVFPFFNPNLLCHHTFLSHRNKRLAP